MIQSLMAAAPLISAGASIAGPLMGLFGGGSDGAQKAANANYELSVRNMQNQARLIAEGMRRSTATTTDSEGNSTAYDPGSNTWTSSLGPGAERVQRSSDNAVTLRNTVDLPNAQRENENSHLLAAIAKRNMIPAASAVANFQPRTAEREFADLQVQGANAGNNALQPVLQDTLRSFARTGSAAAPVISQMGMAGADNMRKSMLEARGAAASSAASNNQSMLGALTSKLGALQGSATPTTNYVNPAAFNPVSDMNRGASGRAGASGDLASKGAAYSAYGMSGANEALTRAMSAQGPNQIPGMVVGLGKQVPSLISAIQDFMNPGTRGDAQSIRAQAGRGV